MSEEGRRLRDEGVERVRYHSVPWRQLAGFAVREVAVVEPILTTDEVWTCLVRHGVPRPLDPRAMGPVMLDAVKAGWIRRTDRTRNSERPVHHAYPNRVYESRIVGRPGPVWPSPLSASQASDAPMSPRPENVVPAGTGWYCTGCGAPMAATPTLDPHIGLGKCRQCAARTARLRP